MNVRMKPRRFARRSGLALRSMDLCLCLRCTEPCSMFAQAKRSSSSGGGATAPVMSHARLEIGEPV